MYSSKFNLNVTYEYISDIFRCYDESYNSSTVENYIIITKFVNEGGIIFDKYQYEEEFVNNPFSEKENDKLYNVVNLAINKCHCEENINLAAQACVWLNSIGEPHPEVEFYYKKATIKAPTLEIIVLCGRVDPDRALNIIFMQEWKALAIFPGKLPLRIREEESDKNIVYIFKPTSYGKKIFNKIAKKRQKKIDDAIKLAFDKDLDSK